MVRKRLRKRERIRQINRAILYGFRSVEGIAGYLEVSKSLVKYYMHDMGLRFPRRSISDSLTKITDSIQDGAECVLEIAVDSGLTENTAQRYCYDYGIKIPRKRKPRKFQIERIRTLVEKGLVRYVEDISRILRLSVRTIEEYSCEGKIKLPPYLNGKNYYKTFKINKSLNYLIKKGVGSISALARKSGYSRTYVRDYIDGTGQREVWGKACERRKKIK